MTGVYTLRRPPVLMAIGLGLLALLETTSALSGPDRVATSADWEAAAAEVRTGFRDGDLVVFAPSWADPVGRAHLGDMVPLEMAARADADRYRRVWEVSIRGAHAPEAAGARQRRSEHGRVTVTLWEKPAAEVGFDFTARLDEARVTVLGASADRPCAPEASGFRCPGSRVERQTLEIDYRPRRGLLVPLEAAGPTRIDFEGVELGRRLVGFTGLHNYDARSEADGPVDLRVSIDGRPRFEVRTRNDDGWKRFEIDTSADERGRHAVSFEVGGPPPLRRDFGFHAETRR